MSDRLLETMARGAGAIDRRGSLRALGGAAVAGALAAPRSTSAGKGGKSSAKRCKKQRAQCRLFFAEFCQEREEPEACEAAFFACCESLADCKAIDALQCIFQALE